MSLTLLVVLLIFFLAEVSQEGCSVARGRCLPVLAQAEERQDSEDDDDGANDVDDAVHGMLLSERCN